MYMTASLSPVLFLSFHSSPGDQMERAKVGETTIRMRERNGERLVGKDSRDDLILVKEKGRLAAIYTLMPLACHQSVSFLQGCLPYRRPKGKAVSHRAHR